jgi:membrane-bound serine protease (ClpP class)
MKGMLNSFECFPVRPSSLRLHSYISSLIPRPSSLFSFLHPSLFILALAGAGLVFACIVFAAWLHHRKGAGGPLGLEGRVGSVVNPLEPEGAVLVDGELWRARTQSGERIARGRVRIVGARGHWLEVEPE